MDVYLASMSDFAVDSCTTNDFHIALYRDIIFTRNPYNQMVLWISVFAN